MKKLLVLLLAVVPSPAHAYDPCTPIYKRYGKKLNEVTKAEAHADKAEILLYLVGMEKAIKNCFATPAGKALIKRRRQAMKMKKAMKPPVKRRKELLPSVYIGGDIEKYKRDYRKRNRYQKITDSIVSATKQKFPDLGKLKRECNEARKEKGRLLNEARLTLTKVKTERIVLRLMVLKSVSAMKQIQQRGKIRKMILNTNMLINKAKMLKVALQLCEQMKALYENKAGGTY